MEKKRVNWSMIGFFIEIFALSLWVGGLLIIIAVVIPAVFNSFGMEPAGRFLRRVFDNYGYLNLAILSVLGLLAFLRFRAHGRDPLILFSVTTGEWWLLGGMLFVTIGILGILGPQAIALQEAAFEAISQEDKESAYAQFFRLHMIVRALHLINVGLAFSLFILKLRKTLFHRLAETH